MMFARSVQALPSLGWLHCGVCDGHGFSLCFITAFGLILIDRVVIFFFFFPCATFCPFQERVASVFGAARRAVVTRRGEITKAVVDVCSALPIKITKSNLVNVSLGVVGGWLRACQKMDRAHKHASLLHLPN